MQADSQVVELRSLEEMIRIRLFEQTLDRMFARGLIRGTTHLAIGQEAVAVGAAKALADQDLVFSTYRGHHHNLARGLDMTSAFAEVLGRRDGCCGGIGGSMHLTDVSKGLMGSYAIVGGHIPLAAGAAWAAKHRGEDVVTACFFGDGTTTIGAFHEALNLAAVWSLPLVLVCENNLYSEYTPIGKVSPVADPAAGRASAYGLRPIVVDGNDVSAVYEIVRAARDMAARGEGPVLIEAKTYRLSGHSRSDPGAYRPEGELEAWKNRDPIRLLAQALGLSEVDVSGMTERIKQEVDGAMERALESPEPEPSALFKHVYGGATA